MEFFLPCKTARFALLPLFLVLLVLANGCVTIPYDYPRTVSSALYLPEETSLGKKIQVQVANHGGASGFYLVPTGVDAFAARALLIDRAEKTLDLQYYILTGDLAGKFLLDHIVTAAERGVRVRLLIDDWYGTGEMDRLLTVMETYPTIEVRVFNPYGTHRAHALDRPLKMAFGPKRLKGRMHNKDFIADNSVAIVGGRNLAAEYFGASSDLNFRDIDLIAVGPITRQVSAFFDDYWNCVLAVPIKALTSHRPTPDELESARRDLETQRENLKKSTFGYELQKSDLLKRIEAGKVPLIWAPAQALSDDPLKSVNADDPKRQEKMAWQLKAIIEEAQSEVLMVSPYFVPGKDGVRWLKKMAERGVKVRIITNSFVSNDETLAQIAFMRYRKDLLLMGADVYELKPTPVQLQRDQDRSQLAGGFLQLGQGIVQLAGGLVQLGGSLTQLAGSSKGALHAKSFVLDRKVLFVGSFNFDPRSERLDTQDGLVIRSPELAAKAVALFNKGASPAYTYRVTLKGGNDLVWVSEENGQEVRYDNEPLSRFWRRLYMRGISWITPESML
jgi:putative cardiolipin synthase